MPNLLDLTGEHFGRLTVHKRDGNRKPVQWICICDCGKTKSIRAFSLRQGFTRSCGCLNSELASKRKSRLKHGQWGTTEYVAWHSMKTRCLCTTGKDYPRYGGRGITVCARWLNFENFLADMGRRPSPKHSIDRINNNGPYAPKNCRWATKQEQQRNKRNNRKVTICDETIPLVEWAERIGISYSALHKRLKAKWPEEKLLCGPLRPWSRKTLYSPSHIAI